MRRRAPLAIGGTLAVVTGAGRGIGRATALALAARGATVVCADVDTTNAEKVAAECREHGGSAEAAALDVADRGAFDALADTVEQRLGPAGILVNNAGVGMTGPFTDMSADDWRWIRDINLDGVVNGCAVFGPRMLQRQQGHVVNLASGLAYTPTATEPAYVTTKAAVLALSQCLRADWSDAGVGVSAICPGVINTPIIDNTRYVGADDAKRRERATKMFRRGHDPELVARAIVDAIERNRAVVAVGVEAKFGWYLHRLAPVAVQQALARAGARTR